MSEHKNQQVIAGKEGLLVKSKKNSRFAKFRAIWLAFGLPVVVIVVVFVIYGLFGNKTATKPQGDMTKSSQLTVAQQYQYFANRGQYNQAEAVLEKQLQSASSPQGKVTIYAQQAAVAQQFNNIAAANAYGQKAVTVAPQSNVGYTILAAIAEQQGNNAAAREYWTQALNHLDKSAPQYTILSNNYQAQIENLPQ